MLRLFFGLFLLVAYLLNPLTGFAFETSDPSVSLLQNRISNNFSRKYCKAIQNGFSKDGNEISYCKNRKHYSFSLIHKKWIEKDDLANQISLQVVNDCGRSLANW